MENKTKKVEIEIPVGKVAKWVDGVLTLVDEKPQDVTERIKTFADACCELGFDHPLVKAYDNYMSFVHKQNKDDYDVVAYLKLRIITEALNEGHEPPFTIRERNLSLWHCVAIIGNYDKLPIEAKNFMIGCCGNYCFSDYGFAYTKPSATGHYARLALKDKNLATYATKQFAEIYADFCFKPK